MRSSPTPGDVAEMPGGAPATVARIVNGKRCVAGQPREKAMRAVRQTGDRGNAPARGLGSNRNPVIGHLPRPTAPIPFVVKGARGLEERARDRGYTPSSHNLHGEAAAERRGIETFLDGRADAPVWEHNVAQALGGGRPVVRVERPRGERGPASSSRTIRPPNGRCGIWWIPDTARSPVPA